MTSLYLVLLIVFPLSAACPGRFVNPITDICWSCLFPISIGNFSVTPSSNRPDIQNPGSPICFCGMRVGVSVGFWEPVRLVDVTRKPYCLVNLGGLQLSETIKGHGGHTGHRSGISRQSFYQVHWYIYPLIYWLELLMDFACMEKMSFDVAYLTELDPTWNDDEMSFLFNAEAAVFGNPIAQLACGVDCAASTMGFSKDTMFWCSGCQGSVYPFTGTVKGHVGGVQSSLLLTTRMIAKLHRMLLAEETSGPHALCKKRFRPILKKSQYRLQMTYPRPSTGGEWACPPIGKTEVFWQAGREFPYKGEDFGYLVWRKRNCCLF